MKFPAWLKVYGDQSFRGECPPEAAEQITVFNEIRRQHPETWGVIALHPRNEGKRTMREAARHKMDGMSPGAPDIVIPGPVSFCCELKRLDHTKSRWAENQLNWLEVAHNSGAFVCVALGHIAALEAFDDYLRAIQ